ncbi:Nucleotide-binding universal stress protein, UspA family [Thermomonospora echinospora]|uniref:Nucleotide-binding universal stress protein, UspA family n=1 Tax=Thermomonospora echinospora TaxID=1992 RepID=A0A1H6DSR8_9ACTN|nr:universal stress protein [Thermomonospora echinospora]SEG88432.1 Nucleotide-binding universal stress protein, UspA family [Thermomonospora echinospora]
MPLPSDPVVVGTDGSAHADRAVEWAAEEAVRRNRPLLIVHAAQPWLPAAPMMPAGGLADALEAAGREVLGEAERLARKRYPDLEIGTRFVPRTPGLALDQESRTAYEVVIGHRGAGGFTRLLLGSTGLQLAGHIPGPVVIVRGDAEERAGEVVVGIDPATEHATALEYAFEAAALRSARLRVVHGRRPSPTPEAAHAIDLRDAEEEARWAILRATTALRKRHPGVEVVEDIVHDHPVAALTEASGNADLVVVGARDRHGLGALRLGSVSHGVIHHAHCPVAVVRPRS